MEIGKRLLPQVVDHYARTSPHKVYASIPKSTSDLSDGYLDITMRKLSAIASRLSTWLSGLLGAGNLETIAYIGPADIRYAAVFLAAVKCRYKVLFVSPRNQAAQNERMLLKSGCRALLYAEEMAMVSEALRVPQLSSVVLEAVPSLKELLQTPDDTEIYPYERSFDEVRDEPCLILHSSGSTGKLSL